MGANTPELVFVLNHSLILFKSLTNLRILVNVRLGSSFVVREIYPSEFLLLHLIGTR